MAERQMAVNSNEKTASNAQTGFLRLPPELRLQIYDIVLSNKSVHVVGSGHPCDRDNSSKNYSVHECLFDDPAYRLPRRIGKPQCSRHDHCYHNSAPRFSLPLVCRQFYKEAASIPLETSNFIFANPQTMADWLNGIPVAQRKFVQEVTLTEFGPIHIAPWVIPFASYTLTSVKRFNLFVEIGARHFLELTNWAFQDRFLAAATAVKLSNDCEIGVKIVSSFRARDMYRFGGAKVLAGEMEAWEERVMAKLDDGRVTEPSSDVSRCS